MPLITKYDKCCFICFRNDFCVGWFIWNSHWSPAKRIVFFHVPTVVNSLLHGCNENGIFIGNVSGPWRNDHHSSISQVESATFAIRVQQKRYLACNCSLVSSETMTFLMQNGMTCFCYTVAAKLTRIQLSIYALV